MGSKNFLYIKLMQQKKQNMAMIKIKIKKNKILLKEPKR